MHIESAHAHAAEVSCFAAREKGASFYHVLLSRSVVALWSLVMLGWSVMKTFALLGLVLLSVGCGSSDGGGGPSSCDPTDRSGTYLLHYSERSGGTCGAVTDQIVLLGASADPAAASQCSADSPQTTSDNGCALSSSLTCTADDGTITKIHAITHQQDANGAHIAGIATVDIETRAGTPECESTYDVTYTRQ